MEGPALSVVVPARDEGGIIGGTLRELREGLAAIPGGFEIVVADDGSVDATVAEVETVAFVDPRVRLVCCARLGRGAAIRAGLAAARGEVIVTTDADLSYGPGEVLKLFEHLRDRPSCDLAIGSCYMPGGRTEGVPFGRLIASRLGNAVLGWAFEGRFHTATGILRAYRSGKVRGMALLSDGKELYLEILHKAAAAGWIIDEMPVTLRWRRGGKASFAFLPTLRSHLAFAAARRIGAIYMLCAVLMLAITMAVAMATAADFVRDLLPLWLVPEVVQSLLHKAGERHVMTAMFCVYVAGLALCLAAGKVEDGWRARLGPAAPPIPPPAP